MRGNRFSLFLKMLGVFSTGTLVSMSLYTPHIAEAITNISACGTLSIPNETYRLQNSVTHPGTGNCFILTADNITLDLQGYTVTGDIVEQLNQGSNGLNLTILNGTVDGDVFMYGIAGEDGSDNNGTTGSAGNDETSGAQGGTGQPGGNGGTGGAAANGGNGGTITLNNVDITGTAGVSGGNGGNGGDARGGDGGQGGRGGDIIGTCSSAGPGGQGGQGGDGGTPSQGGNGGNTGSIIATNSNIHTILINGGDAGNGGDGSGGQGGVGGQGGDSLDSECAGGTGGQGGVGGNSMGGLGNYGGGQGSPNGSIGGGGGSGGSGGSYFATAGQSGGNTGSVTATDDAPSLTLNGPTSLNLDFGATYVEQGGTATDLKDGNLTVHASGTVNSNVAGQYIITYSASDLGTSFSTNGSTIVYAASSTVHATRTITVLPQQLATPSATVQPGQLVYSSGNSVVSKIVSPEVLPKIDRNLLDPSTSSLPLKQLILPKEIGYGQRDASIKDLQIFLNTQGFTVSKSGGGSPGKETDMFGPLTRAALIKYQRSNNIWQSEFGTLRPITRAFINIMNNRHLLLHRKG